MDQRNEENRKYLVAYPPIPTNRFIKNEPGVGEDHDELNSGEQLDLEPLVAYHPIPRAAIKQAPLEEQECEEQAKQLIAYPPIPRRRIKEESQTADNQDEFNPEEHQLIFQEEGNQILVVESTSAPIITGTTDMSTTATDRGNGTDRRKSQKGKKIIESTAVNSQSTGSDDQSAKTMPTIRSRARRSLYHPNRGSTSMARDDDEEKNVNSTAGPDHFGGHKSDKRMPTVSSRTRRYHPKQSSASKSRDDHGEKNKKRKMTVENKDTENENQQNTKDDKRRKSNEHLSPDDVDSSSSSDETSERPSECHLGDKCGAVNKFPCKECGHHFTQKRYLHRHLLNVHKVNSSQLAELGAAALCVRPALPFKCEKSRSVSVLTSPMTVSVTTRNCAE